MHLHLSLPEGYRVNEVDGRLHLFDPQGMPLPGPKDPSLIEAYAWRHAWRHIARELNEELADVQAGARSLHSCRRLRQYMRMLDAVRDPSTEVEERPVRRGVVAWGVLATAAAIAAVFLMSSLRITSVPENPPPVALDEPGGTAVAKLEAPGAAPSAHRASAIEKARPRAVATSRSGRAKPAETHGPVLLGYAVSFGTFFDRATADTMMHFIRSKGYVVYVARIGEEFSVVTKPYRTRAQAERLAAALQEIDLPAQVASNRAI